MQTSGKQNGRAISASAKRKRGLSEISVLGHREQTNIFGGKDRITRGEKQKRTFPKARKRAYRAFAFNLWASKPTGRRTRSSQRGETGRRNHYKQPLEGG